MVVSECLVRWVWGSTRVWGGDRVSVPASRGSVFGAGVVPRLFSWVSAKEGGR